MAVPESTIAQQRARCSLGRDNELGGRPTRIRFAPSATSAQHVVMGQEADSCAAANFSSWFMLGKRLPRVGRSRRAWRAISGNRNERIDDPTSQLSSAYCKASRSVDCAFGSAICRANPLGCQNLLFPVYRARTGLRAVWVNNPLPFLFLVPHKTRPGLRLDCVSGVVRFYLQHSVSLRYRIRSSSPHARAISPTSN
jgi:hypothetical protein